jgi:hypothetical protein
MDIAERYGSDLRRLLLTADRLSDAAIRLGFCWLKTPFSSVSASLCSVTWRDHRRPLRRLAVFRRGLDRRLRPLRFGELRDRLAAFLDAPACLAMAPPCWNASPFNVITHG